MQTNLVWFIKQNVTLTLTLVLALRTELVVLNCDVHKQSFAVTKAKLKSAMFKLPVKIEFMLYLLNF